MRLFALRGADAVTVRDIAGAASVSPALVIQHYGSKDGLREAVDAHVLAQFEGMISEVTRAEPASVAPTDPRDSASLAQTMSAYFPTDSAMPDYLARMLVSESAAASTLFRQLFELARAGLDGMVAAGTAAPGANPNARAAVLLANDLAVIILHRRLNEVLRVDPLSPDGMALWGGELLAVYGGGLTAPSVPL